MITNNLKNLLSKLNTYSQKQLNNCMGYVMKRGNSEISCEHLFVTFFDEGNGDIPALLDIFDLSIVEPKKRLLIELDKFIEDHKNKLIWSDYLLDLIEIAWTIASVEFNENNLRSAYLMLALFTPTGKRLFPWVEEIWGNLSKEKIADEIKKGINNSVEEARLDESKQQPSPEGMDALKQFTENLTAKAKDGKIDPVFARDDEIRQMIDILMRRRKNNPILVGDPGTGKTAIVEGLALKVIEGDMPPAFKDVDILTLDLGLLQAGASVKGEFENRLKTVIKAIKNYSKPVITFIDEAHTLIGAGGTAGQSDAANLLKPALARGELRTIAATTWSEYKKYFEKDPALDRRFQLVKIAEPDDKGAFAILRGLKEKYAKHHMVRITDDAITTAVTLSRRYITGRQLPDKAIDLLDTASARVGLSQHATPAALVSISREISTLEREKQAIMQDRLTSDNKNSIEKRLKEIDDTNVEMNVLKENIEQRWDKEKQLVNDYLEKLNGFNSETSNEDDENQIIEYGKALKDFQKDDESLIFPEVNGDVVASIISDWTGIPIGRMIGDEAEKLLNLENELKKRIMGQYQAIHMITEILRVAKSGLKDPNKPMGVFMLVGPSGVGKTETALALADLLFGGEQYITTINMSEFQEKHNVSRLIGSPPGYVGYGEGGVLTEAVRQKPYTVVLLDEVEKAHPDIMELFFQVFDKGVLSDGEGRVVNFSNTVIILTSNMGSELINKIVSATPEGTVPMSEDVVEAIRPTLAKHFRQAFLARTILIPYYPLSSKVISGIVRLKLSAVEKRLDAQDLKLQYDQNIINWLASRCNVAETGARNVEHVINTNLLPQISIELLTYLGQKDNIKGKKVVLYVVDDKIAFKLIDKDEEFIPPEIEKKEDNNDQDQLLDEEADSQDQNPD